MKILIVAGGGGHFAAALAVIEKLPEDWDVRVIGRKYTFEGDTTVSLEYQTAKKLGILFIPLITGRLQRKFTAQTVRSLMKLPVGFWQAYMLIKSYKPDVLLSFGGYVSVPVALAASIYRVPIVVHEQVLHAGLSNKFVSRFADAVCVSWEESETFFPKKKIFLTGNPMRKFSSIAGSRIAGHFANEKLPIIYITGGSGGAHAINILVEGCLEKLLEHNVIIHQTGDAGGSGDYERLRQKREILASEFKKRYYVEKFIEPAEVGSILHKAELVISRAGINTITELLYFGKPCLLIPLPYGQRNEQMTNAMFVKKVGLAEVADQKSLTSEKLSDLVRQLSGNLSSYQIHAKEAKLLVCADAAEKIVEVIADVVKKKKIQKS